MKSESVSHEILARALAAAGADEADAAMLSVDQNISRFANSSLHQNMSEVASSLTLRVVLNGAIGVAATTSFTDEDIRRTAELAREAARHASPTPGFKGLQRDSAPLHGDGGFDEETASIAPKQKAEQLAEAFRKGREQKIEFAGVYNTAGLSVATANSHGLRRFATTTHAEATFIALNGSASGYSTLRDRKASRVDIAALADEAIQKATLCLDSVEDLEPGKYAVILEPAALAEVFEWLNMIAFTGQSFEDQSSFLVDRIGQQVAGTNITIADDGADRAFLPFPFDMEGTPKGRTPLIEGGIARSPVVDKAYADRLGFPPTGNAWQLGSPEHGAAFHIDMAGGESTREEMIASTKLGIWVTRFNYVNGLLEPRTALMTGTTRDGTFLVRDGRVVSRLPNLRWTQSIADALKNVEALSAERRIVGTWYNPVGGTIAPTIKVSEWGITGKQVTT